jgi:hypothetical protein
MNLFSNIIGKSLVLIAGFGLLGTLAACESAQPYGEDNALAVVTGELDTTTDWTPGDIGLTEGTCGYLCNDGATSKIIGACFAGTRCDRSACERQDDGMLVDACVKIQMLTPEHPDTGATLGVEVSEGQCGYKCEDHKLAQVEAFCASGTRCPRIKCAGPDRSFTMGCIDQAVTAPTTPATPKLPAQGECDYRCLDNAVVSYQGNCDEGQTCDAAACSDAPLNSLSASCINP